MIYEFEKYGSETKAEIGGSELEAILRGWMRRTHSRYFTTYKGHVIPLPEFKVYGKLPKLTMSEAGTRVKQAIPQNVQEFVSPFSSSYGIPSIPIISKQLIAPKYTPKSYPSMISSIGFKTSIPSIKLFSSKSKPSSSTSKSIISLKSTISKPSKPSILSIPSIPSTPSKPSKPSIPSIPSIPSPPSYPSIPSIPTPSYPNYPSIPKTPFIPSPHKKKYLYPDDISKIKMELKIKPFKLGYRERSWKTIKIENLLR